MVIIFYRDPLKGSELVPTPQKCTHHFFWFRIRFKRFGVEWNDFFPQKNGTFFYKTTFILFFTTFIFLYFLFFFNFFIKVVFCFSLWPVDEHVPHTVAIYWGPSPSSRSEWGCIPCERTCALSRKNISTNFLNNIFFAEKKFVPFDSKYSETYS